MNDSKMFGNVADSLVERLRRLEEECEDITLVFDGGNTSEDNMKRLSATDYHFITSLTLTHHQDLLAVSQEEYEKFSDERLAGIEAYRTQKKVWGEERTIVVTLSDNLLYGQVKGIEREVNKVRAKLWELKAKVRRSQEPGACGKGYTVESLEKRLKAITKRQYIHEIVKTKVITSKGRLDFTFRTDQRAYQELFSTRLGKRILCTDNHDWSTSEIILGSRAQYHVENAFKGMKNPHWVRFSPVFHWTDQKLRVHVAYCVLALTLTSLLRRKAAQAGVHLSVPRLYEELSGIREVVNLYPPDSADGRGRLRAEFMVEDLNPLQQKLYKIFALDQITRS
jgi:transposase